MRKIYRVGNTSSFVAEVADHPATNEQYLTVDFVRPASGGQWEVWQRGQTNREPLVETEFTIE